MDREGTINLPHINDGEEGYIWSIYGDLRALLTEMDAIIICHCKCSGRTCEFLHYSTNSSPFHRVE